LHYLYIIAKPANGFRFYVELLKALQGATVRDGRRASAKSV